MRLPLIVTVTTFIVVLCVLYGQRRSLADCGPGEVRIVAYVGTACVAGHY